ncbi:Gti1/Pac2 family-domain-containing protein [Favolaschia claudopus]|uniref:Gti1/Pac2 family-domain-containing protein n=1 Tax=Favolaschia claudopus TaxID=2862362 RepID=A0AAW0BF90_9AGAR
MTSRLPQPETAIPSFYGIIETTLDALRLIYATQRGAVPSVNRCLNDVERRTMIKSGAIFVYRAQETAASSWTDGLLWSLPRRKGDFLLYESLAPTIHGLTKKTITILIERTAFEVISYYSSVNLPGTLQVCYYTISLTAITCFDHNAQRPSAHRDMTVIPIHSRFVRVSNLRATLKVEQADDGTFWLIELAEGTSDILDSAQIECEFPSSPEAHSALEDVSISGPRTDLSSIFYGARQFTITNSTFTLTTHPHPPHNHERCLTEVIRRLDRIERILGPETHRRSQS